MHIHSAAKQAKSETELAAILSRLTGAGIPQTDIHHAIELMRTGRADLLARVITGDLDVVHACRLARVQPR
jgi:hypothetical protein